MYRLILEKVRGDFNQERNKIIRNAEIIIKLQQNLD